LQHFDFWIPQFVPDGDFGFTGYFAPQVRGIPQLGFAVVNPQVNRPGRLALDDNGIKAGKL
jgi:hypothetical protein